MRRWFQRWFSFVGKFTTAVLVILILAMSWQCATKDRVPSVTVLELRLDQPIFEYLPEDSLAEMMHRKGPTLRGLLDGLERAGRDDRVRGVIAHIGGTAHGMAITQELRDAIQRFREQGKFAIAFAETFGEFGPGNEGYYLATAFDEIWLQPSGDVGLTGLLSQSPFVKGTLEKLDVEFLGDHRKEYKNAFNLFTERRFTPAHKEAIETIMNDMFGQLVRDVGQRRGIADADLRATIDRGPFLGAQAVEAKLVDQLGYRDEVFARARELAADDDAEFLYLGHYRSRLHPKRASKKIALIYGLGQVQRGSSKVDPFDGSASMGSDTVAAAFRSAVEDDDVVAILFRVDSPGGSYVASDTIWRETVRARKAGKPVIVSMGDVAGSGGYFVAMNATKIVAQPATITGSIGVLGGKPMLRELWNTLGITWDSVQTSSNASMWSTNHGYDGAEWERFQGWLDRVYEDFTTKAAAGRGMKKDDLLAVAKGRIWSGERAKTLGLVDELGGMWRAEQLAREAAGLDPDERTELAVFPRPKPWWLEYLGSGPQSSEAPVSPEVTVSVVERWQPLIQKLEAAGLWPEGNAGVLSVPLVSIGP